MENKNPVQHIVDMPKTKDEPHCLKVMHDNCDEIRMGSPSITTERYYTMSFDDAVKLSQKLNHNILGFNFVDGEFTTGWMVTDKYVIEKLKIERP